MTIRFVTALGNASLSEETFYRGLVQHVRNMSLKESLAYFAEETGYKEAQVKAAILAFVDEIKRNAHLGQISYMDGVAYITITCKGAFKGPTGPWVKGTNWLELVNVQPEIVGEADGARIELNRVFDLAQKIPPAVIYGRRPFRCQGINIVTTDEGARVFIRNRKGMEFDVVVDEIVSSQEFTAHTPDLLEPGDYHVVVLTRGGNPDGTVREVDKPVKYLRVIDPPTVDSIASEGKEGIVKGEAFAAVGANLSWKDGDKVTDKWTQDGEEKSLEIVPIKTH